MNSLHQEPPKMRGLRKTDAFVGYHIHNGKWIYVVERNGKYHVYAEKVEIAVQVWEERRR